MFIEKATITGADDGTRVPEMVQISKRFPFVEWGILFGSHFGMARFPSMDWVDVLIQSKHGMDLCAHLCGRYLRDVIKGEFPAWLKHFKRVQLNWHGEGQDFKVQKFLDALKGAPHYDWIFQIDGTNNHLFQAAQSAGVNCAAIFDTSHGAGVVPDEWPRPLDGVLCTYAGGLGPQNIVDELKKIERAAGDNPICIDMETHVRSHDQLILNNNDRPHGPDHLDLEKVKFCLQAAQEYIPF